MNHSYSAFFQRVSMARSCQSLGAPEVQWADGGLKLKLYCVQVGVCQITLSSSAGVPTESVLHTQMNTLINSFAAATVFLKKSQIFQILNRGKSSLSTGLREATASRQTVR